MIKVHNQQELDAVIDGPEEIEICGDGWFVISGISKPSIYTHGTSKPCIYTCGTSKPTIVMCDSSKPTITQWADSCPCIKDYREQKGGEK
jgi:hypothetical protein